QSCRVAELQSCRVAELQSCRQRWYFATLPLCNFAPLPPFGLTQPRLSWLFAIPVGMGIIKPSSNLLSNEVSHDPIPHLAAGQPPGDKCAVCVPEFVRGRDDCQLHRPH